MKEACEEYIARTLAGITDVGCLAAAVLVLIVFMAVSWGGDGGGDEPRSKGKRS